MRKIIGITGLKGSGKDTIGDIICKNFDFQKVAFADKLKDVVSVLFNWDRKMLSGFEPEDREIREKPDEFWSKKLETEFTPRMALQKIGTEVMRNNFNKSIWVYCLENKLLNEDKNFVVTDVRFRNEIEMIKRLGGTIIRVERCNRPEWWNLASEFNALNLNEYNGNFLPLMKVHNSERDWIDIDRPKMIFENNGTIEELEEKVVNFMNSENE